MKRLYLFFRKTPKTPTEPSTMEELNERILLNSRTMQKLDHFNILNYMHKKYGLVDEPVSAISVARTSPLIA